MGASITKAEAAKVLSTSTKTVDRETQRGRLKAVGFEMPETGGKPGPLFNRKDVEKLRDARSSRALMPGQTEKKMSVRSSAALVKLVTEAAAVPLRDKSILTFPEASRLTGVPESVLREGRKSGTLAAVRMKGKGNPFRVWRVDLDVYVQSLREQ